jgi:predicted nucleotidyltransferase
MLEQLIPQIMVPEFSRDQIEPFCKKHHIKRLSLFGSELHGDNAPGSDIDILVEFEEGHIPGFAFAGIQRELSELLGRHVDLHTPESLSRYFRTDVVKEARPLYVASKS